MRRNALLVIVSLAVLAAAGARPAAAHRPEPRGATVEALLELDVRPFAIAHRGFGDNPGTDHSRPIENTVAAVRAGFTAGATVVEVDVQLTRDRKVVAFHNDFLGDFRLGDVTCLSDLTFEQLTGRLPFVPRLEALLEEARSFNQAAGPLRGLVIIELKAAAPGCDLHDTQDRALVLEVSNVVRRQGMTRQVMFTSFSPALLQLASEHAPEIVRILAVSGLQLLTADQIAAIFGYPVVLIDKKHDVGLQWAEVGPLFRLPGYGAVDEVLATAIAVGARLVEADLVFLGWVGVGFVDAVHALGLKALGFTATNATEWSFLESLGSDGIYTDDVGFGVAHQAAIP